MAATSLHTPDSDYLPPHLCTEAHPCRPTPTQPSEGQQSDFCFHSTGQQTEAQN